MKGQISPVTMILLSAILIALVGVAYMWGAPLIEKQSVRTQYTTGVQFMKNLDGLITEIANSGGSAEMSIPFGLAEVVEDGNYITFQFPTKQPLIFSNTTTYIGEVSYEDVANEVGVFGKSKPGIISLQAKPASQNILVEMNLHYRELDSSNPPSGYKILLKKKDRGSGTNRIIVTNEGSSTAAGGAANSGDLVTTTISLRIS